MERGGTPVFHKLWNGITMAVMLRRQCQRHPTPTGASVSAPPNTYLRATGRQVGTELNVRQTGGQLAGLHTQSWTASWLTHRGGQLAGLHTEVDN